MITAKEAPRLQARIAGLAYLIIIAVGGSGYFAGSSMIVRDNAAATASNILAAEPLWRLGLAAMLIMLAADVVVACIFYVLFKPVNRTLSLMGFAFRLVMAAVLGFNLLTRLAAVLLLTDPRVAVAFEAEQTEALAYFFLRLFERGFSFALVFFGFSCLAIGWLILRSTFLPRILGAALAFAGLCYLVDSFINLLLPALDLPFDILLPCYVIEIAFTFWLIVMGVNADKWKAQAGATSAAA